MPARAVRFALLWLLALAPSLHAQATGTVRGRVTTGGTALADAQVSIAGTRLGSVTSANGEYLIAGVSAGRQVLVVRRIGYAAATRTIDVAAGQTLVVDVPLTASATTLSEVVVTGTGTPTEKRALGTTVATVDADAIAASRAITVDGALQGKVAGAQITQNSGNPGGGGISVRLRGTSSLISGSEPLYIVDGVFVDNNSDQLIDLGARSNVQNRLADLNPNDIERIEIIKGAAAAALYGSRANNGVVQIFTKRGRSGPPSIRFGTSYTTAELANRIDLLMYPFDAAGSPVTRYDYQDDIFARGETFENHLSAEGGDATRSYYAGGSWRSEDGIIPGSGSSRKSVRLNVGQEMSPKLRLDLGANFVNTHNDFEPNGESAQGVITAILFTPTTFSFYQRPDGTYPAAPTGSAFANPLEVIARWKAPQDVNRFIGSAKAAYHFLPNLKLDYTLGYDGYSMEVDQFIPRNSLGAEPTGYSTANLRDSRIISNDGVATLTNAFRDLALTTSAGFNHTRQLIRTTVATARDLIPTGELVGSGVFAGAGQARFDLVTLGFFGQQSVAWREKLYLTGAVRWDASSTFGPDERWQVFPKASVSYVAWESPEGSPLPVVNSLRLRGAVGFAGNQPSIANAYARYDSYGKLVNDGRVGVANSPILGNSALKPERQREFEGGLDVGLFQSRIGVEATYYDKRVSDLLLFRPLPTSTGYSQQFENIGVMSNKGIELMLRTINFESPRFRWESTVTYSRNRNRIEKLDVAPFTLGYANRVEEGEPVGFFYAELQATDANGVPLFDAAGLPLRSPAGPGRLSGKVGDPNPDWLGSLLNEFSFGSRFRARVLLDGSFGNDVLNFSERLMDIFGTSAATANELLPDGDPRKAPRGYRRAYRFFFGEYVEDGTYVKLRELSLSYAIPARFATRLRAAGAEASVSGRNLYTWTDYTGYDPELNLFGTRTVERGNDFATYPIPRTWTFGVQLTY